MDSTSGRNARRQARWRTRPERRQQTLRALALLAFIIAVLAGTACESGSGSASGGAPPPSASETIDAGDFGDARASVAQPTDDVAHPGARTEWWYVHAIDPAGGRAVIATFFTAPFAASGGFVYSGQTIEHWTRPSESRPHEGPGVTLSDGGVSFDEARDVWTVRLDSAEYEIYLELADARPGITAGPLGFGDEEMSWTVPVATSVANGYVVGPDGRRTEIRNWRGYHDHNWGDFDLESTQSAGWEWAVVHEGPGRARLLGGINQLNGDFDGALVSVTPAATTGCRPEIERENWTEIQGFAYPRTVNASCDGEKVRFTVTRPYVVPLTTHALTESIGRTDTPGSLGFIEHFAKRERAS
jgi:hypothetical protein